MVMAITRYALLCGGLAGVGSMAALALFSTLEGRGPWRPANATSHWLHGDRAARRREANRRHTLLGLATHLASALFWALPFGGWLASRPPRTTPQMLRDSAVMAAFAGAFDYLVVPRRLTPGWELAVSPVSVVGGFAAMALGLAAGGLLAQSTRRHAPNQVQTSPGGRAIISQKMPSTAAKAGNPKANQVQNSR
jgi:hypothetical protein